MIKKFPIKIDDVNIAENILFHSIRALKCKSTRRKPKPVKDDVVEMPTEIIEQHKDFTHCMDIMFVNDLPILTRIARTVRYQYMAVPEHPLIILSIQSD